jgi:hypothetical protein
MTAVTPCDVLEASTPEVHDVVRLEDRYGRAEAPARAAVARRVPARKTSRSKARRS